MTKYELSLVSGGYSIAITCVFPVGREFEPIEFSPDAPKYAGNTHQPVLYFAGK